MTDIPEKRAPFHISIQRFNHVRALVQTVGMQAQGYPELEIVFCPEAAQHQIFDIMSRVALKVISKDLDLGIISESMTAVFGGDFGVLNQLGFTMRNKKIRIILPDAKGVFAHGEIDIAYKFQWDPSDMVGFDQLDLTKETKLLEESLERVHTITKALTAKYSQTAIVSMLVATMIDTHTMNKKIIQALGTRGLIDNNTDLGFEHDAEIVDNILQIMERYSHMYHHGKTVDEVSDLPREEL